MQELSEQIKLLGKQVVVKLNEKDKKAVARGMLLSVSDDGEICILGEDRNITWCWPALEIISKEDYEKV